MLESSPVVRGGSGTLKDGLTLFEMHPNAQNAALSLLLPQACNTEATCAAHGPPYRMAHSIQHWLPRFTSYLKWEVKGRQIPLFPRTRVIWDVDPLQLI